VRLRARSLSLPARRHRTARAKTTAPNLNQGARQFECQSHDERK
jgi:hypothetical protein